MLNGKLGLANKIRTAAVVEDDGGEMFWTFHNEVEAGNHCCHCQTIFFAISF